MPSERNGIKKLRIGTSMLVTAGMLAGCQTPETANTPVQPMPGQPTAPTGTSTSATPVKPTGPSTAPADPTIATIGTTNVRLSELQQPLLRAYGFNLLMLLVQRDMARDACREQNVVVTDADIKYENDWTLGRMFADAREDDDRQKLLDQFLAQPKPREQMSTRDEWDIVMDTNAHLRKLVEPTLKKAITDDMLQQQFDEEYGAQAHVRDIQVSNPQEGAGILRQIAAGKDFATLASEITRDPNAKRLGGELAPFSMHSSRLPEDYKRVAFSLKPGEVSDMVMAAGAYHIIKLERIEAPRAVKFADVKDSLRQDFESKLVIDGVAKLKARLAQQALGTLKIDEPTLKADFDDRLHARDKLIRDKEKIRTEMEKQRGPASAPASSAPATMPTTATKPATVPQPPVAAPPTAVAPPVAPPPAARPPASPTPPVTPPPPAPPVVPPPVAPPVVVPPVSKPPASVTKPATAPAAAATGPTTRP